MGVIHKIPAEMPPSSKPCWFHSWAVVKDTGVWAYQQCSKCGNRRIDRLTIGGYQPVDRQWVDTGRFLGAGKPPNCESSTGLEDAITEDMAETMTAWWENHECQVHCRSSKTFGEVMAHRFPQLRPFVPDHCVKYGDYLDFGDELIEAAWNKLEIRTGRILSRPALRLEDRGQDPGGDPGRPQYIHRVTQNPIEEVWRDEIICTLREMRPNGGWVEATDRQRLADYLDDLTGLAGTPPTFIDYADWQHGFTKDHWDKLVPLAGGFTYRRWIPRLREMLNEHREYERGEPQRDPNLSSLVCRMRALPDNEPLTSDDNIILNGYTACDLSRPPDGVIVYTCGMIGYWKPRGSWTNKRPAVVYKGCWRDENGHKLHSYARPSGWRYAYTIRSFFDENGELYGKYSLFHVVLSFHFRPKKEGGRGRAIHISLKKDGSDLKSLKEDDRQMIEGYLKQWGILEEVAPDQTLEPDPEPEEEKLKKYA